VAWQWQRREINTKFWLKNLKGREVGRPRRVWEGKIRMDLREIGRELWTGFNWLRIGTSGVLL
jgi:hypothetical protein